MLIIKSINSYRDGGSISLDVHLSMYYSDNREPLKYDGNIVLDRRCGFKEHDNLLWFGYPENEGSTIIEDKELREYIKAKIVEYVERYSNQARMVIERIDELNK